MIDSDNRIPLLEVRGKDICSNLIAMSLFTIFFSGTSIFVVAAVERIGLSTDGILYKITKCLAPVLSNSERLIHTQTFVESKAFVTPFVNALK